MLGLREVLPPAGLRASVWSLWVHHIGASDRPYRHRMVPNGSVHVMCRLGGVAEIMGPHTRPVAQLLEPGTVIVGARFRPGAAFAMHGPAAAELVDRRVPAELLTGRWGRELGLRLAEVNSATGGLRVLAEQLAARTAGRPSPDPAVGQAVRQLLPGTATAVSAVADAVDMSDRQLRRRFDAAVGLAPKKLQQLLRFQFFLGEVQSVLHRPDEARRTTFADLAARAGFADQSHLNRDCLRFTGMAPSQFMAETALHCGTDHEHAAAAVPLSDSFKAADSARTMLIT